ncbi:MAG: phosphoglycerate kinase [Flavobacteriales bacterium]|nr:MAG: phosphoglycerate kinase [Flavobacteriales bacterium]CAI8396916.1 MAG: Phosphoglycerate kinase [Flavobacteriales bacterium]|tara:strand:+ start:5806 stop:6999 length:1194 start_codon:yes stop_codon:yes gene_type:complete
MLDLHKQDLNNKRVIVRVDLNVPVDQMDNVTDITRIEACQATIELVLQLGGSCVLLSHLGRPRGKDKRFSLKKIVTTVSTVLNKPILFFEDCIGDSAEQATLELEPGQIILMENLRFYEEETAGDIEFAKKLARLGDLYVNDAFGTSHREHASTATIAKFFKNKKFAGNLLQKELEAISQIANHGEKPVLAILGGAKVSSKLSILYNLVKKVDKIIIGGGMAYTFLKAKGGAVGKSLLEEHLVAEAKEILLIAKKLGKEIILPTDILASKDFDNNQDIKTFKSSEIDDEWMGLDIGVESAEKFKNEIFTSKTIFWNGPVGVFEKELFSNGTRSLCTSLKQAKERGINVIVGGGDSIAALKKLGNKEWVSYISTGGGALLESLEGKTLPGVKALANDY